MDENQPPILNQSSSEKSQGVVYENHPQSNTNGSVIAILLLIFLLPIGIIYMWIASPWSKGLKWFLTFIFVFLPIGLLITIMSLNSRDSGKTTSSSQNVQESSNYKAISINVSFSYPKGWVIQDKGGVIILASKEIQSENGKSFENRIDIKKYGTKPTNVTLREHLVGKNKQQTDSAVRDSDFKDLGETTSGNESVKLINTNYVTNGQDIISITYPIFGVDSSTIDKITNSLTFN